MPFLVVYVEDTESDVTALQEAFDSANEKRPAWAQFKLEPINHPSALEEVLSKCPDLVLADVYFQPSGTKPPTPETDHLNQIIETVKDWDDDEKSPNGFPTPVIAYTGVGRKALASCLDRRRDLYDIWDKMSAGTDYVAWRFQQLQKDLPRHRPDATIQRLVATMLPEECPEWHKYTLASVRKYGEGQTEREQVAGCEDPLRSILDTVTPKRAVALLSLWTSIVDSEPLLRAASPKLRGIGRHSINVFWFGYWLINHPLLKPKFVSLWSDMLKRRSNAVELDSLDSIDGINTIWIFASLFHDVGKFHEYGKASIEKFGDFFKEFNRLDLGSSSWCSGNTDTLLRKVELILSQLSSDAKDPMRVALNEHVLACALEDKPDHGAVSAAYLYSIAEVAKGDGGSLCALLQEAARAVLLHSCLPEVSDSALGNESGDHLSIDWEEDPLACLLLLCDQVQTWDRHDQENPKLDFPDRAELAYLEVKEITTNGTLKIDGCVDYIAPSRIDMYPKLREDITTTLNKIILEKPKTTLLHVIKKESWPFHVHFDCALSGEKLDIDMDIPSP